VTRRHNTSYNSGRSAWSRFSESKFPNMLRQGRNQLIYCLRWQNDCSLFLSYLTTEHVFENFRVGQLPGCIPWFASLRCVKIYESLCAASYFFTVSIGLFCKQLILVSVLLVAMALHSKLCEEVDS